MEWLENCGDPGSLRDLQALKAHLDHIHDEVMAIGLVLPAKLIGAASLAVAEHVQEISERAAKSPGAANGTTWGNDII